MANRKHRCLRLNVLEQRALPATLVGSLFPPDLTGPQDYSLFGAALAAGSQYYAVGAPRSDLSGDYDCGEALVYDAATRSLVASLPNPYPSANDYYGNSVAVAGSLVLVGAYQDDAGSVSNVGSAFLYDMNAANKTTPIAVLNAPTLISGDQFGYSVALSGKYAFISAIGRDSAATNSGSVFVYDLTVSTTTPFRTINNPTPQSSDYFGRTLAAAGTRVAIGSGDLDNYGAAYVYDIALPAGSSQVAMLASPIPFTGVSTAFAESLAIAGNYVVVGAFRNNAGATSAGSAFVYDLTSATPTIPLASIDNPAPSQFDYFGKSVAVVGTTVIVGAPGEDSIGTDQGAAYYYDLLSGTPTVPTVTLNNPAGTFDSQFGHSAAVAGKYVLIGSSESTSGAYATSDNAVHVFDRTSATPTVPLGSLINATTAAGESFGGSVAADGRYVVVGAPSDGDAGIVRTGRAFVYDLLSPTPLIPILTLNNPSPAKDDRFGTAVAISGQTVAIGSPFDDSGAINAGLVYVYDLLSPTPEVPILTIGRSTPYPQDNFGTTLALAGNDLLIGAPNGKINLSDIGSGIVFLHDLKSATPTAPTLVINNPLGINSNNDFGMAIALSGNRIAVGAPLGGTVIIGQGPTGTAYLFDRSLPTPTTPQYTFTNPNGVGNDMFGAAVDLGGLRLVIGAPEVDIGASGAGAAFVYQLSSATPTTPTLTLNNPSAAAHENFGTAVRLNGTNLVVSGDGADSASVVSSSVYVFDTVWGLPTTTITSASNPAPDYFALFGRAIAVTSDLLIVGAPGDSVQNVSQGAVRVFRLEPPQVESLTINGGQTQRSRVTRLDITFDQPVTYSGSASSAFQLRRQSDNAAVTVNAAVSGRTVTLTFVGGAVEAGSLADGRYTLTIDAQSVTNPLGELDGNGNGTAGDDFVLTGNLLNKLFRLFGDADGNGTVGGADFLAFRLAFLTADSTFDADANGSVDAGDFLRFRLNYLQMV
ncbi:MAG: Ig-like domain-containing protein [Gemmataceae bacterium]|nr:Ig-like domain-containing protein [Gemmataceae bacterium]